MVDPLSYDSLPQTVEQLRQTQIERLQMVVNRACRNVQYYHELFDSIGLLPDDIAGLDDLSKIPLTPRQTMLERQPYGMLAVPPHDVVRIHSALGPGGHPIVIAFTAGDIRNWTLLCARMLRNARVGRDDTVYICLDYGQSSSAMGAHYGAEALGATVIPRRTNITLHDRLDAMRNFRVSSLVCTPSFAREVVDYIEKEHFDAKTLFLRSVILVDEPCTDRLKKLVAERLFVNAYQAWGPDELYSPVVAVNEPDVEGLVVNEDHLIAEVVDLKSGEPLPEGTQGEVVLTSLTQEALPLLRYRTGEIGSLKRQNLKSGREVLCLVLSGERTDDLVYSGGAKFYPEQVGGLLESVCGEKLNYSVAIEPGEGRDIVRVLVEVSDRLFEGEMTGLTALKDRLEMDLFVKFGAAFLVKWVGRGELDGVDLVRDNRREI